MNRVRKKRRKQQSLDRAGKQWNWPANADNAAPNDQRPNAPEYSPPRRKRLVQMQLQIKSR
jgi:hypothetical protein